MRWYPFISSRASQEVFTGGLNLTLGSCLNQRHFYCGAANRPVFNHNYKLRFCEGLQAKKPVSTGWAAPEHAAAMPHPLRLDSRLLAIFQEGMVLCWRNVKLETALTATAIQAGHRARQPAKLDRS
jgi:hypothetical protein